MFLQVCWGKLWGKKFATPQLSGNFDIFPINAKKRVYLFLPGIYEIIVNLYLVLFIDFYAKPNTCSSS